MNPICEQFGGVWGEHLDFPVEYWQDEVSNDDTRLGYWDYVEARIEQEADDE